METEEIERHLYERSRHHDAELTVAERAGAVTASFRRPDGTEVLAADGQDRAAALKALYELDELEDLAGG
jgi:hypothetical protein